MKLISAQYLGFTAMDRRFSSAMLPWIVSEIKKRDSSEQVCLGAEDGTLQAYNIDFELQFSHRILDITRFSQADTDPCAFLYLLRDDANKLLYCYLFQAFRTNDVSDLWHQMREQGTTPTPTHLRSASLSGISNLTSLCLDISPSSSHFFEVLYIGKIKVSHKKVPETFIDDALDKFRAHELEKGRSKKETHGPPPGYEDLRRGSQDSTTSESSSWDSISIAHPSTITPTTPPDQIENTSETSEHISIDTNPPTVKPTRVTTDTNHPTTSSTDTNPSTTKRRASTDIHQHTSIVDSNHGTRSSSDTNQHNRTMVLQVGRTDLRLISPDRKLVLLHKQHRDVVRCVQGTRSPEHFGFVCKETGHHHQQQQTQQTGDGGGANAQGVGAYVGFVFKCESTAVTADAVAAISQASTSGPTDHKPQPFRMAVTSCDHCPMLWYHRLCTEVEGLSDRKTQATIYRRIDQLEDDEQTSILTKFRGAETDSIRDQNEFLMMLLRAHCEMKQNRHVHDTAENRSEFLNQYLGGGAPTASTIFMKARRSLSNSFDHLLKRKGSRDDFGAQIRDLTLPLTSNNGVGDGEVSGEGRECAGEGASGGGRARSYTIGSQSELKDLRVCDDVRDGESADKNLKSPMMDIFMKVGNSPKSGSDEGSPHRSDLSGSWRQAIFNRVVTPNKHKRNSTGGSGDSNSSCPGSEDESGALKERNGDELRALWQKSIHQAILLVRMEKENAKLKARQEETAVKRIKLEYDELTSPQRNTLDMWEHLITKEPRTTLRCDQHLLRQAIRQGIPRGKRGDVWQHLADQYQLHQAPVDTTNFPNYNVPYDQLLKQLTSHQHAILIDLGRTFPNHAYFSSPLGPGQLALFNLLKAYSLLDPEVGYCQGLSFVAGVLLLHMDECDAFKLLKHLMFVRGLRAQYLPDMVALQVRLYQLSRLLHDKIPDLYIHLDKHEVAPTLYAAPWLLTLFASQFPLGFVARVFDFLFAENTDVVFRVALALLTHHREQLLACESFEEIMEYLKTGIPSIDKSETLDAIMKQIYLSDITKQLNEYRVEYHVLQEEATSSRPQIEELKRLRAQTTTIVEQNRSLSSQVEIALSNVQRLERTRAMQQATINRLEMQCRGLEVSVVTLGTFIDDLIDRRKLDVQIPGDVRRIVSQLMLSERRKIEQSGNISTSSLAKTISNSAQLFRRPSPGPGGRIMVKSLSTGRLFVNSSPDPNARSTSLQSQSDLEKNLKNSQLAQTVMTLPDRGFPLRVIDDDDKPYTVKSLSNPNLGSKVSNFFSNSHSHILQHHRHGISGEITPPLRSPASNTIKQIIREDSRENLQQYADRSGSVSSDCSLNETNLSDLALKTGGKEMLPTEVCRKKDTPIENWYTTNTNDSKIGIPVENCNKTIVPTVISNELLGGEMTLKAGVPPEPCSYNKTGLPIETSTKATGTEICTDTVLPTTITNKTNENNCKYALTRSLSLQNEISILSNEILSPILAPDNILSDKVSPTSSVDSGVGTPVSPQSCDGTSDRGEVPAHPLSSCDVNFKFNGTTKLRTIRSIRNLSRNSSPDLLGK